LQEKANGLVCVCAWIKHLKLHFVIFFCMDEHEGIVK
jgi:hypothetical protein